MGRDSKTIHPRGSGDVADMAIAVQANLVQLAVAQGRRLGGGRESGVQTPAPGAVLRFRDVLLDSSQVTAYDDLSLTMRLRETWGQHCVMCWFFSASDPQRPPDFRDTDRSGQRWRCPAAVAAKGLEIEKGLWRLRFELRIREQPQAQQTPEFRRQYQAAMEIPVPTLGHQIQSSSTRTILLMACEFAGMLAALRWIADQRWQWADPAIMDLPPDPPSC